jgi:hypothetical protein
VTSAQFPWGIAPLPRQVTNATAAFINGIMANILVQTERTFQSLRFGTRGYCATYATGPATVRVGDRLCVA